MQLKWIMIVAVVAAVGVAYAQTSQPASQPSQPAMTKKQEVGYALGYVIGQRSGLRAEGLDVDALAKGLAASLSGVKPVLSEEQMNAALQRFQKAQAAREQAAGKNNLAAGQAFLAANAKKPGVKTLPSGLQYKVVKAGAGAKPKLGDTVNVHYRGTLVDGTEFDSSYKRGKPASFELGKVIKGWNEGLALMSNGAQWELYIPANLAYGPNGPPDIGPNATLIFDVKLIDFKSKP